MTSYPMEAVATAIAAIVVFILTFCAIWLIFYTIIGTLIKGRFCLVAGTQRRYKPLVASGFIFSLLFMNPWALWFGLLNFYDKGVLPFYLALVLFCMITWLLSVSVDYLCFNIISKWKWFHWMAFQTQMPQYLWIQLIMVITGIGLAFGIAYIVVRAS
ncbi:hypothetical protein FJZ33_11055 [Candidatus Poribacteria bacterium]|nr:hypothetical protein [Candidatus Poribacteria bacterium]